MAGTTINPYRFGGRFGYRTDLSNRLYIQQRQLDTTKGRWISRDRVPITAADFNFYWYVKNNPVNYIDPDGNAPQKLSPTVGLPASLKKCLTPQAQKTLLQKLNNPKCASAIKDACKESGLASLNDSTVVPTWIFPQPSRQNPHGVCTEGAPLQSGACLTSVTIYPNGSKKCQPEGICLSHSTCTQSNPFVGSCGTIWELGNACGCKNKGPQLNEATAKQLVNACGCGKFAHPGGAGGVKF